MNEEGRKTGLTIAAFVGILILCAALAVGIIGFWNGVTTKTQEKIEDVGNKAVEKVDTIGDNVNDKVDDAAKGVADRMKKADEAAKKASEWIKKKAGEKASPSPAE